MPFNALAIPMMIASPGDVQAERDVVRSVIHEWNAANSISREVILIPVGWETHSAPDLGGRPQEIINERLLKDCDLLVGIFWTKLGTPTGKSVSGSAEEIERHLEAGKPAMVYFSSVPVAPQSLDAEQYDKLNQFKDWCKTKGLIENYDNLESFRQKFVAQLQIQLASNPYLSELISAPKSAAVESMSPALTDEAKTLLLAAAESNDGFIMQLRMMGGTIIQSNNQSFGGSSPKEQARWEKGLKILLSEGLIVPRGVKGEAFQVTDDGYELAEKLSNETVQEEEIPPLPA
ncbi:MAG: DUF4062 domain-containing protein [Sphingomonadales bacterium]|nr:DUF4062 domain-containing protein [Sphingomonadales bacterium]